MIRVVLDGPEAWVDYVRTWLPSKVGQCEVEAGPQEMSIGDAGERAAALDALDDLWEAWEARPQAVQGGNSSDHAAEGTESSDRSMGRTIPVTGRKIPVKGR